MGKRKGIVQFFASLYGDGFRNMTWGKPLVWLILLKLFILFAILRVFFFKPAMRGLTDKEKSEAVGLALTKPGTITEPGAITEPITGPSTETAPLTETQPSTEPQDNTQKLE